jgi:hypothetical protein
MRARWRQSRRITRFACDPLRECFTKQSLGLFHSFRPFSLHGLSIKLEAINEKPSEINDFRGSVVDYRVEISNLDLVKGIAEVVEYLNPKE